MSERATTPEDLKVTFTVAFHVGRPKQTFITCRNRAGKKAITVELSHKQLLYLGKDIRDYVNKFTTDYI